VGKNEYFNMSLLKREGVVIKVLVTFTPYVKFFFKSNVIYHTMHKLCVHTGDDND